MKKSLVLAALGLSTVSVGAAAGTNDAPHLLLVNDDRAGVVFTLEGDLAEAPAVEGRCQLLGGDGASSRVLVDPGRECRVVLPHEEAGGCVTGLTASSSRTGRATAEGSFCVAATCHRGAKLAKPYTIRGGEKAGTRYEAWRVEAETAEGALALTVAPIVRDLPATTTAEGACG